MPDSRKEKIKSGLRGAAQWLGQETELGYDPRGGWSVRDVPDPEVRTINTRAPTQGYAARLARRYGDEGTRASMAGGTVNRLYKRLWDLDRGQVYVADDEYDYPREAPRGSSRGNRRGRRRGGRR